MRVRCESCGGVYVDVLPDGIRYFHACPPLSRVELAAEMAAGRVRLPAGETVDLAIARRDYPRPARRDENVPSARGVDSGRLKASGRGVTELAP